MLAALLILGAANAAPATVPPPAAPPAPPAATAALTLQQRFDKAMELAQSDCVNAVPAFEELKTERAFQPSTLGGSMLLVHQGICLVQVGLHDLGETRIEQGLPGLRQKGDQFGVDIADAQVALGDVALARLDYAGAKGHFLAARAILDAIDPLGMNIRLAKATAFDGGPEPLGYAAEAIRLAEANRATSKDQLAAYHTIHARILLNQGQNKPAYDELKQALKLSGGLGLKVSLADIALRSDLAVAAQLSGDVSGAQEYLVYTGAGRMPDGRFGTALSMAPPVCGSETGLRPEDMAIVQFAVGKDGRVMAATTTYSRGSAQAAAAFGRAVSNWIWDPESIKMVPAFQLNAMYVELRCTETAQSVPGPLTPIRNRFAQWANDILKLDNDGTLLEPEVRSSWTDRLRALAASGGDANDLRAVAVNGLLAMIDPASPAKIDGYYTKALAAAAAAQAPQDAINGLEVAQASFRAFGPLASAAPRTGPAALAALLEKPGIAQDALAADTVRVQAATKPFDRPRLERWKDYMQQTADDDRLPEHHPLRQLANLALANEAASRQDFATAQRHFAATGLTEEQCALIGPNPAVRRNGLTSDDFPAEALQYGFEGWVSVEFDIRDNGRTADLRPIVAYPPFIFNSAAMGGLRDSMFEASYRPAGGNACSASRRNVVFGIPR